MSSLWLAKVPVLATLLLVATTASSCPGVVVPISAGKYGHIQDGVLHEIVATQICPTAVSFAKTERFALPLKAEDCPGSALWSPHENSDKVTLWVTTTQNQKIKFECQGKNCQVDATGGELFAHTPVLLTRENAWVEWEAPQKTLHFKQTIPHGKDKTVKLEVSANDVSVVALDELNAILVLDAESHTITVVSTANHTQMNDQQKIDRFVSTLVQLDKQHVLGFSANHKQAAILEVGASMRVQAIGHNSSLPTCENCDFYACFNPSLAFCDAADIQQARSLLLHFSDGGKLKVVAEGAKSYLIESDQPSTTLVRIAFHDDAAKTKQVDQLKIREVASRAAEALPQLDCLFTTIANAEKLCSPKDIATLSALHQEMSARQLAQGHGLYMNMPVLLPLATLIVRTQHPDAPFASIELVPRMNTSLKLALENKNKHISETSLIAIASSVIWDELSLLRGANICHTDVHAGNILCNYHGTDGDLSCVWADFGSSVRREPKQLWKTLQILFSDLRTYAESKGHSNAAQLLSDLEKNVTNILKDASCEDQANWPELFQVLNHTTTTALGSLGIRRRLEVTNQSPRNPAFINQLASMFEAQGAQIGNLTTQNEAQDKTIEDLSAENKAQDKRIEDLSAENKAQDKTIEDLTAEIQALRTEMNSWLAGGMDKNSKVTQQPPAKLEAETIAREKAPASASKTEL